MLTCFLCHLSAVWWCEMKQQLVWYSLSCWNTTYIQYILNAEVEAAKSVYAKFSNYCKSECMSHVAPGIWNYIDDAGLAERRQIAAFGCFCLSEHHNTHKCQDGRFTEHPWLLLVWPQRHYDLTQRSICCTVTEHTSHSLFLAYPPSIEVFYWISFS